MGKKVEVEWTGRTRYRPQRLRRSKALGLSVCGASSPLISTQQKVAFRLADEAVDAIPARARQQDATRQESGIDALGLAASRRRPVHAQLVLIRIPRGNGPWRPQWAPIPRGRTFLRPRRQFAREVGLGRLEREHPRNRRPAHAVRGGGGNQSAGQNELNELAGIAAGPPIVLRGQLFPKEREHFGFEDGFSQRRSRAARKAEMPITGMESARSSRLAE